MPFPPGGTCFSCYQQGPKTIFPFQIAVHLDVGCWFFSTRHTTEIDKYYIFCQIEVLPNYRHKEKNSNKDPIINRCKQEREQAFHFCAGFFSFS